jgi:hypothetical protein
MWPIPRQLIAEAGAMTEEKAIADAEALALALGITSSEATMATSRQCNCRWPRSSSHRLSSARWMLSGGSERLRRNASHPYATPARTELEDKPVGDLALYLREVPSYTQSYFAVPELSADHSTKDAARTHIRISRDI